MAKSIRMLWLSWAFLPAITSCLPTISSQNTWETTTTFVTTFTFPTPTPATTSTHRLPILGYDEEVDRKRKIDKQINDNLARLVNLPIYRGTTLLPQDMPKPKIKTVIFVFIAENNNTMRRNWQP
jgi:hypothetical protein